VEITVISCSIIIFCQGSGNWLRVLQVLSGQCACSTYLGDCWFIVCKYYNTFITHMASTVVFIIIKAAKFPRSQLSVWSIMRGGSAAVSCIYTPSNTFTIRGLRCWLSKAASYQTLESILASHHWPSDATATHLTASNSNWQSLAILEKWLFTRSF